MALGSDIIEKDSDERLMRRYQSGEEAAFHELYERHSGRVHEFLSKKVADRSDADDLHQVVFTKFHRLRHDYDPKYAVLQWLYVIARTALIDHYRKVGREADWVERGEEIEKISSPENEDLNSPNDKLGTVEEALSLLPEDQKSILRSRYMDDETYEEIAKKLGKTEASVRKVVSRALKKLKESIQLGSDRNKSGEKQDE